MARVGSDELSGSMACLGLVIEQPNLSVREVGLCLEERFSRCRFARSTAHATLPRLASACRVRRSYEAPGSNRAADRYQPTQSGIEAFRRWMYDEDRSESETAPALRDAMYGRIELCSPEHLPRLIEQVRREEQISADLYGQASRRVRHVFNGSSEPDVRRSIREVLLFADPMHWAARADRYKVIADRLEEIQRQIEREAARRRR